MTAQRWSDSRPSGAGWCQAGMHASPGTERQHRGCGVTTQVSGTWDLGAGQLWPLGSLLGTGSPELVRSTLTHSPQSSEWYLNIVSTMWGIEPLVCCVCCFSGLGPAPISMSKE